MSQERGITLPLEGALRAIADLTCEVDVSLASHTTLRIGGPATTLVTVGSVEALVALVRLARERELGLHLLGLGSNVLIPDEGLSGLTFRLDGEFKRIQVRRNRVRAGAAVPLGQLARQMSARGLLGLESLSGFPSTVGGAVFMNAGCYGTEISDLLRSVGTVSLEGECRELTPTELEPGYRSTRLQRDGGIVTAATLELCPGDGEAGLRRIAELNRLRKLSMPTEANAGSVFRNPEGDHAGRLIDQVGLKGARVGQAQISAKHANVVVNLGGARARDVLDLMLTARRRVLEATGIVLEPELILVGALRDRWLAL